MKIFNYTVDVYKTDTPESIRAYKIKNFKVNAMKGLIDAELQLELNIDKLEQAIVDKEEDSELEKLTDSVTFQEKSIKNYHSQLAVLDKQ